MDHTEYFSLGKSIKGSATTAATKTASGTKDAANKAGKGIAKGFLGPLWSFLRKIKYIILCCCCLSLCSCFAMFKGVFAAFRSFK